KNPMARALRVDKVTLSGFEATLRLYAQGLYDSIPTLRMIRCSDDDLKAHAEKLAEELSHRVNANIRVIEVEDAAGGGSCPEIKLKGWGVSLKHKVANAGHVQKLLRSLEVPVLCGARDDEIVIHVRTILDDEYETLISALEGVMNA
ncbi:MAG: L-seryl-tRNA(Sec) selenium transferase, partial [Synergistaceae bacterium]|nr:L-seryl-tRNA(Sec) selenium transferase [Synergistaceae bacterium]